MLRRTNFHANTNEINIEIHRQFCAVVRLNVKFAFFFFFEQKNIGKIMIDAKIHGKYIFAKIKLDQADCHEFVRNFFARTSSGKFEFREDFWRISEKIFKEKVLNIEKSR